MPGLRWWSFTPDPLAVVITGDLMLSPVVKTDSSLSLAPGRINLRILSYKLANMLGIILRMTDRKLANPIDKLANLDL